MCFGCRTVEIDHQRLQDEYQRLVRGLQESGQIDDSVADALASPVLPKDIAKEVFSIYFILFYFILSLFLF